MRFDSQLMMAESEGKLIHSYRVFFMGHKGDMEARYTVNKGRLPDHIVEDMRAGYARAEHLETTRRIADDPTLPLVKVLLQVSGYTEDQLGAMDLGTKSKEELIALIANPEAPLGGSHLAAPPTKPPDFVASGVGLSVTST